MNARNNEVCLLYSESDKARASLLTDALNYYSIDIWQAQNISIGSQIINETTKALEKAKFVIVLWSNSSVKSALLKDLATEAKKNKKVLIPVLIENVKIPGEFLDIQPANLIGWDGDRENEQIVKLWRLIQDKVLKYRTRKINFNQLIAIASLILTVIGIVFGITTPEVRRFFKLQSLDNSSSEKPIKPSEIIAQSPAESNLPASTQTIPTLQSTINPLPNVTPTTTLNDNKNSTTPNENLSQQTVEVDGFIFKLQSCKRLNQNLKCDFLITNTSKDKLLRLFTNYGSSKTSRLFDVAGNEYNAESIEIGASQSPRYVSKQLIQNVDVRASINFVEIPSQVNQVKVIEISTNLRPVQFRNIVISN